MDDKETRMFHHSTNLRLSVTYPMRLSLLLGLLFITFSLQANTLLYSKADLEILQSQKSYNEFFKHAKDIVPTQRDRSWYEMLSDMGTNWLDDLRRKERFKEEDFQKVEKIAAWPEFKRDEFFQVKREAYVLGYFNSCLGQGLALKCKKQMESFWKTSRKEAETGYQLMLLHLGFFPKGDSFPFIEKLVKQDLSKFYCDKPNIQKVFTKYLIDQNLEIALDESSEKRLQVTTKEMAHKECWDLITPYLKTTLFLEDRPNTHLFTVLHHLKALSPIEESYWLTHYYLTEPEEGPLLNLAWNNLEELSQNYALRGHIFKKLTQMDPLPGKVFAHENALKRKVFTQHMAKNFPEYIAHYSKKCVNYLTGKEVFPRGNPTMQCNELFETDQKKKSIADKVISQEVHLKYSGVMKKN